MFRKAPNRQNCRCRAYTRAHFGGMAKVYLPLSPHGPSPILTGLTAARARLELAGFAAQESQGGKTQTSQQNRGRLGNRREHGCVKSLDKTGGDRDCS